MSDFKLTDGDRMSPLWAKISEHLKDRMAFQRQRNDQPLTETQTAHTRGRIAQLKELLALGDK